MDPDRLEKMLQQGVENAMLRYTLAMLSHKKGRIDDALEHVKLALSMDSEHSASWKLYGKLLVESGNDAEAIAIYRKGIEVAERKGDVQAAKEMKIFLKRLVVE